MRNLSKRPLTEDEKKVLAPGLNYAVTPKSIPTHNIIATTEATAKQLDTTTAEKLRAGVSNILQSSKAPRSNLPTHLCKATKELRNEQDIIILPADKGNATVVMDRKDYVGKINEMLKDKAYGKLKKDPTTSVESRVNKVLRRWVREERINRKV